MRSRFNVILVILTTLFTIKFVNTYAQKNERITHFVSGFDLKAVHETVKSVQFTKFSFVTGGYVPFSVMEGKYVPSIATKFVLVGLPEGASLKVSAECIVTENLAGVRLSPFENESDPDDAFQKKYLENQFYQSSSRYPTELAKVEGYSYIGGQYVAQVRVSLLQYVPSSRTIYWNRGVKLQLDIEPTTTPILTQERHTTSEFDEAALKRLLINYETAKKWRHSEKRMVNIPSTNTWYNPSNPYLKLYTAKDGVYRVTGQQLAESGVSLAGVNPRTFKMYYKGNEVPIRVQGEENNQLDADDAILFLGAVNRGSPEVLLNANSGLVVGSVTEHLDVHSDTSVFWLTWGGTFGRRIFEKPSAPNNSQPQAFFRETEHFEKDRLYITGFTDFESITTERVPGEGWIWKTLQVNNFNQSDSLIETFRLNHPSTAGNAELRIKLVSATFTTCTATVFINGSEVTNIVIPGRGDVFGTATFPMGILQNGDNQLTIRLNVGSGSSVVNFDWFKVTGNYLFNLSTSFDQSKFSSQSNADIEITNATTSDYSIFNLLDTTILTGVLRTASTLRFNPQNGASYFIHKSIEGFSPVIRIHQNADLRNTNNVADYIIITHPLLKSAANRLSTFRQSTQGGSFTTKVVTTEEIFAEFSNGFFTPQAIQDFLKYAYNHWRQPRPRYVVLMGSGTWDPKNNFGATEVTKKPLIPVYGNPVSEIWFVSFENAVNRPYVNLPKMSIGRIAACTVLEANDYVDKLVETSQMPSSQAWYKQFLFITGGIGSFEQTLFKNSALSMINTFVIPAPVAGIVDTIFRDDNNPFVSTQAADRMQARINSGTSVINFVGHAGSQTWDFTLGDPSVLQNRGKYPLVMSWTCHTGRFAEPNRRTFGEIFLLTQRAGANNFIGTAGYGYVGPDEVLNRASYRAIADSTREVGMIWNAAYQTLLSQTFFWSPINICSLDQYNIQGDPAQPIVLPLKPDFEIEPNDVTFDSQPIFELDDQKVKIYVKNLGLASPERVKLSIHERASGSTMSFTKIADTLLSKILVRDSVTILLNFKNRSGQREIEFRVNEGGEIDEVSLTNNTARLNIVVFPNDIVGVLPFNYSVLSPGNASFGTISTSAGLGIGRSYQFEIDTTLTFESPLKRVSGDVSDDTLKTIWQPQLTPLLHQPYYWRVRIRNPDGSITPWRTQSIMFDTTLTTQGEILWRQEGKQLAQNQSINTKPTAYGITIANTNERLRLRSVGTNIFNLFGQFFYEISLGNSTQFRPGSIDIRGLNISILDTAKSLTPTPAVNFDIFEVLGDGAPLDTTMTNRLVALIDSMPNHAVLLVALSDAIPDPAYVAATQPLFQAVINRFASLGSRRFPFLRLRESWVFAGSKDGRVYFEDWGNRCNGFGGCDTNFIPTIIDTVLKIPRPSAKIETEPIGPASEWGTLFWKSVMPTPQTIVKITVIGITSVGKEDSILTVASVNSQSNTIDLKNISTLEYPFLKLNAELSRDVFNGTSPILESLAVRFTATGDAATSNRLFSSLKDTVRQGDPIDLTLRVKNIGYTTLPPVRVDLSVQSSVGSSIQLLQKSTIDSSLSPEEYKTISFSIPSAGFSGNQIFSVDIDPENRINEITRFNNQAIKPVYVAGDSIAPTVEITFNGQRIQNGALVSRTPRIKISAADESPLPLNDTLLFNLRLGNTRIYFNDNRVVFTPATSANNIATVLFTPELQNGRDTLRVSVRDASGNFSDSATSTAAFNVESEFKLENLYNYPNPFRDETTFAFRMTGELDERPTEFKIRIYTVAGRLIKDIDVMPSLNASFNGDGFGLYRVHWDGRDNDGDMLANGVYIYRITIKTPKESINKTEKLAIIR